MELLSACQKLVASNIANADTPGYHIKDIDFQQEFLDAAGGPPQAVEPSGLEVKNDGNKSAWTAKADSCQKCTR
jgi:flagellar basal body rod protein FlgB